MDSQSEAVNAGKDLKTVQYETQGDVALIRLNRPDRMNALSNQMKDDLAIAFFELARSDSSRCVIVTGAGDRAFCAGADIKERAGRAALAHDFYLLQKHTHQFFNDIADFEKPVIAAINGLALGGGLELAMCCDIRIAAEHARFGLPEVKLGAIPAAGGTQRLPRLIGASLAKELMFTGDFLSAERALAVGLVSCVVPTEDLLETTLGLAHRVASQAPLAIRYGKQSVNLGMAAGLEAGLEFERYAAAMLSESKDRQEGMLAFVEKRDPQFQGK